jgi:hypothetical protein
MIPVGAASATMFFMGFKKSRLKPLLQFVGSRIGA